MSGAGNRPSRSIHCYLADEGYGTRIAEAPMLDMGKVKQLATLSNDELNLATMAP